MTASLKSGIINSAPKTLKAEIEQMWSEEEEKLQNILLQHFALNFHWYERLPEIQ